MAENDQTQTTGQPVTERAEISAKQIFNEMKASGFTLQEIVSVTRFLRGWARTEVEQTIKGMQEFSASI